ncbi:MAG: ABC transporter ATP-binding protein [Anaerocolumna sp.]
MQSVIKISSVSKRYGQIEILKDINVELEKGKIYGIVGRNGSGKSILLKLICGLVTPTKGEIIVLEQKIQKGSFPQKIGVMLDSTGFLENLTAFENLNFIASINNVINKKDIKNTLELVGLNPDDKKKVGKFSTGMKQKLGLAQAIMEKPQILLLDEPMNGLDEESVIKTRELIKNIVNLQQVTTIMTSHMKEDIKLLCDEIILLENKTLKFSQ